MKSQQRSNLTGLKHQEEYSIKLDKLFDIAHAHAENLIMFEEDRQFLAQQRMDRSGSIGGIVLLAALGSQSEERRGRREQLKVTELESLSTCKKLFQSQTKLLMKRQVMMRLSHTI